MTAFIIGILLCALVLMIGIEIAVIRNRKRPKKTHVHRYARRQPLLEDRMRAALEEPNAQYGAIFTSYNMLYSGDPWLQLNEFTRAIVVRHIWRTLEKLAKGSVVIIDQPPQEWSEKIDGAFDDRGIDPRGSDMPKRRTDYDPDAPAFIKDR